MFNESRLNPEEPDGVFRGLSGVKFMAFISSCPKCQKQVLVPDGTGSDALVQCPVCAGEYTLAEILASAPPALIVVHPGGAVLPTAPVEVIPAASAEFAVPESSEATIFPAHRVEPTMHDADPLLFEGDELQLASLTEEVIEPVLSQSGPETAEESDHHVEALAEPFAEPFAAGPAEGARELAAEAGHADAPWGSEWGDFKEGTGHDDQGAAMLAEAEHEEGVKNVELAAEPGDADAPWGGAWGDFKEETGHEHEGAAMLAEAEQDQGLENVDFADITGKAAPGSALAAAPVDGAAVTEPVKKKKRKREPNMVVRFVGMAVMGLLALACVIEGASWMGVKMDFLPSWVPLISNYTSNRAGAPNPGGQRNLPAPNANQVKGNAPPGGSGAGKTLQAAGADSSKPAVGNAAAEKPATDKRPDQNPLAAEPSGQPGAASSPATPNLSAGKLAGTDQVGIAANKPEPGPAPGKPSASDAGPGSLLAMNEPVKEAAKPAAPASAKPSDDPSPFSENTKESTKPAAPAAAKAAGEPDPFSESPDAKPAAKPPVVPDASAPAKPQAPAKSDDDLFGNPPAVAPVMKNGKPDAKADDKPPLVTDASTPAKPQAPAKPDEDLFASPPAVAPVKENGKPDAKPPAETGAPTPAQPAPPAKSNEDLFAGPPAVSPVKDNSKPAAKPDVSAPLAPDAPDKGDAKPGIAGNPSKAPELMPDQSPVIGPEPKPELKPEPKPEPKLDEHPPVKAATGVGPLEAHTFSVNELDASLKAVSGDTTIDTKSYADWCKVAEVATYVEDGAEAQRQAMEILATHAASTPAAVSAIANSAKKLFEGQTTKGGVVLAGRVSGVATKNGLSGTAIRMEGLEKPVMIFSAQPLGVKENDKVIVFGALVADPAKNLAGYHGKLPIAVWSNFATAIK